MVQCQYLSVELLLAVPLLVWLESGLEECTDLCEEEIMVLVFLAAVALSLLYTFGLCDPPARDCFAAILSAVVQGLVIGALAYFVKDYLLPCRCA